MEKFRLLSNSQFKRTKVWFITVYIFFFVFLYYLLVWLFLGEMNISGLNYLVFQGHPLFPVNDMRQFIATFSGPLNSPQLFLDNILLYWLLIPLAFHAITISLIHYATKQTAWDMIPMVYSFSLGMLALIFGGAFTNAWSLWILLGRIILIASVFFISFIILNYSVNRFIMKEKSSFGYFENALNQEIAKKELKDLSRKMRLNAHSDIIDVAPQNIFFKRKIKNI
ncbi:MPN565 family protein [[Mycoplasma] testudinis]|uniref:MPN565 family protein n=1 Tax=[Mycoplasma] testudinis TaxID=33924 RepID=UPI00047F99D0|nr:hypothetical protein [[Mycoplasma] testudinis]